MRVRRAVLDAITEHARREQPRECCGLLLGTEGEVTEAVATSNVADDPLRRYEIAPLEHLTQLRRCRVAPSHEPLAVVGAYHSHPRTAPVPSPTDLDQAFEDFLFVIAGPVEGKEPFEIRGYRLRDGRFEGVTLTLV